MAPPSDPFIIALPVWLAYTLAGGGLVLILGLLSLAIHYRRRLTMAMAYAQVQARRSEALARQPVLPPDARPETEAQLAELTEQHYRLQQTYKVLLARHKKLLHEGQQVPQRPPVVHRASEAA